MQASLLLSGSSSEDIVTWYGIAGGIPLYLEQFDAALSLAENLATNVLQPDCFLFGEPDSFLQQEVREPARYNAVIRAIANGEGRLTDIADAAGIERTAAAGYLKGLEELGIVRLEKPVVDANRKKTRYVLNDNLFRSWYRFVPRYLTPIQAGRAEEVAPSDCRRSPLHVHGPGVRGSVSPMARRVLGARQFLVLDVGRWWGTDNARREQAEIDIVALCDENSMICGECKPAGQADRYRSPPHVAAPRFPYRERRQTAAVPLLEKRLYRRLPSRSRRLRVPPRSACRYGAGAIEPIRLAARAWPNAAASPPETGSVRRGRGRSGRAWRG